MGDRSQIAVKHPTKKDPKAKVYLYGHWVGNDIYKILQKVIKANPRLYNSEYLTRIIAREMGMGEDGETGFGIGTCSHLDIEHVIPVLDVAKQEISFEDAEWDHNKNPIAAQAKAMSFADFAALWPATFKGW